MELGVFLETNIVPIVLGVVSGLISGLIIRIVISTPQILRKRKLSRLMNMPKNQDLMFIYPPREELPREEDPPAVLPQTTTEDFMAINNLYTAFLSIGWDSRRFVVRDTGRVGLQYQNSSAFVICSAKSNRLAKEIQEKLLEENVKFFHFEEAVVFDTGDDTPYNEWVITNGEFVFYRSKIYREIRRHSREIKVDPETEHSRIDELKLEDVAAITKVKNPWDPSKTIVLLAGVRGIGTWGAAETIKKGYEKIYEKKPGLFRRSRKTSSFSAVVKIRYVNSDITEMEVLDVIDIHEPY